MSEVQSQAVTASNKSVGRRLRIFLAVLLIITTALALRRVDARRLVLDLAETVHARNATRPWSTAGLAVLLVAGWLLVFLPLVPLEISLGFLFGFWKGYTVVFLGRVLGSSVAFGLGRTVARGWAKRMFGEHELMRAINLAVARQPYKVCFSVRLACLPMAVKNLGLAVVSVRPMVFFVTLVIVEAVQSSVLVTVGCSAEDLGALISGGQPKSAWQLTAMAVGGLFLLALLWYMSVLTRQALQEVRDEGKLADGALPPSLP